MTAGLPGARRPARELLPLADGDEPGREGRRGEGGRGRLPGRHQPLPESGTAGQSRAPRHRPAGDHQQQRDRRPHRRQPHQGGVLRESRWIRFTGRRTPPPSSSSCVHTFLYL